MATGLQRVSAAGGPTTVLTRPDRAQGEADHLWPEMLPGGRAVLFTITALTGGLDAAQVAVLDLQTGTRTVLVRGGSHAHYVPSGHLVYAAAGTLRAVPFDLARLETRGTPVPVVPDVVTTLNGGVDAVVAGDGTLAYVSGSGGGRRAAHARVGGPPGPRDADPGAAARLSLSRGCHPTARASRCSPTIRSSDIWLWDLGRTTLTRSPSTPGDDIHPGVDARRPPADLQLGAGGRAESLLAGGRRHRRGRAADRESQHAECRRPCRPTAAG